MGGIDVMISHAPDGISQWRRSHPLVNCLKPACFPCRTYQNLRRVACIGIVIVCILMCISWTAFIQIDTLSKVALAAAFVMLVYIWVAIGHCIEQTRVEEIEGLKHHPRLRDLSVGLLESADPQCLSVTRTPTPP